MELDRGGEATEAREINEAATLYFQKLFMSNRVGDLSYLLTGIKKKYFAKYKYCFIINFYTRRRV